MDIYKTKLEAYEKPNGNKLSKNSIDLYVRNIKMLVDKHGYDWKIVNLNEFFDSKKFTPETSKSYMNSIINYLKMFEYSPEVIKIYIQHRDEFEKIIQNKPKLTDKKKLNLVEWDEIIKWYNLVKKENQLKYDLNKLNRTELQLELLLCLYITYPRRNELADLKFGDLEGNCISHKDKRWTLILQDFKTDESFGRQEFEIPEELTELNMLLNKLTLFVGLCEGDCIFKDTKGNPLSRLNLTKTLQRSSKRLLDGKSISTNMIRHSFNQSKFGDMKEELIKDSYIQGHSVGVKLAYYVI
tara:strand:+ start:98 stop:991 length:894 start_codon:yes stop_codon:yes gene_type:complete